MARKLRVYYPGAVYHVIARGNNKENIFIDDDDKTKYLRLIRRYKDKYNFELFAYVLMDNHIHLLVQVNEHSLAKIMQGIQLTYTQYYNRRYLHVGHVFEQRYKAFLCDNDAYLVKLICYIHQNPVRAQLDAGIDYFWSSHKYYDSGNDGIIRLDFILDKLHYNRVIALKMYRELVGGTPLPFDTVITRDNTALVPASEPILPRKVPLLANKCCTATLEELAAQIALDQGVDLDQLMGRCRAQAVVKARGEFICKAIDSELASKVEVARWLQLDPARITRVYQKAKQEKK